jgi:cytochrome c biogenesis protein CcmG/thiol:disulfide interchange protein DsbE
MKPRTIGLVLFVAAALFVIGYVLKVAFHQETPVNFAQSVDEFKNNGVPDFHLPVFDLGQAGFLNGTSSLSDTKARAILVNFWATWCEPCLTEFPSLTELARRYKGDPRLKIFAISEDNTPQTIKKFLERGYSPSPNFTILIDRDYSVAHQYGTKKIPETYIIDEHHHLIQKVIDKQNWVSPDFLQFLNRILGVQR